MNFDIFVHCVAVFCTSSHLLLLNLTHTPSTGLNQWFGVVPLEQLIGAPGGLIIMYVIGGGGHCYTDVVMSTRSQCLRNTDRFYVAQVLQSMQ